MQWDVTNAMARGQNRTAAALLKLASKILTYRWQIIKKLQHKYRHTIAKYKQKNQKIQTAEWNTYELNNRHILTEVNAKRVFTKQF